MSVQHAQTRQEIHRRYVILIRELEGKAVERNIILEMLTTFRIGFIWIKRGLQSTVTSLWVP
jgi:hypothetical protein